MLLTQKVEAGYRDVNKQLLRLPFELEAKTLQHDDSLIKGYKGFGKEKKLPENLLNPISRKVPLTYQNCRRGSATVWRLIERDCRV